MIVSGSAIVLTLVAQGWGLRQQSREIASRQRPWISLGQPEFFGLNTSGNYVIPFNNLFDQTGLKADNPPQGNVIIKCPVRNLGGLPAHQLAVRVIYGVATNQEIAEASASPADNDRTALLFPSEVTYHHLDVPYVKFASSFQSGSEPLRIRIHASYCEPSGAQRWTEVSWAYLYRTFKVESSGTDDAPSASKQKSLFFKRKDRKKLVPSPRSSRSSK